MSALEQVPDPSLLPIGSIPVDPESCLDLAGLSLKGIQETLTADLDLARNGDPKALARVRETCSSLVACQARIDTRTRDNLEPVIVPFVQGVTSCVGVNLPVADERMWLAVHSSTSQAVPCRADNSMSQVGLVNQSGGSLATSKLKGEVRVLAANQDGSLALLTRDGRPALLEIRGGEQWKFVFQPVAAANSSEKIRAAAFLPDGKHFATLEDGQFGSGRVLIWNLDGHVVRRYSGICGKNRSAYCLAVDNENSLLVLGQRNATVSVFPILDDGHLARPVVDRFCFSPTVVSPSSADVLCDVAMKDGRIFAMNGWGCMFEAVLTPSSDGPSLNVVFGPDKVPGETRNYQRQLSVAYRPDGTKEIVVVSPLGKVDRSLPAE